MEQKKLSVIHAAQHEEKRETPPTDRTAKVTVHAFICVCILCAALVIRSIDAPWSLRMREGIATALTFDIDAEETLGRLKFVQMQMEDTVTAFAEQNAGQDDLFRLPVTGAVLRSYSADSPCVLLNVQANQSIACPASGIVSDVTQESIAIDFSDGTSCVIHDLGSVNVKKDDTVTVGQRIGFADEVATPIRFYVYQNGTSIDPEVWAEE